MLLVIAIPTRIAYRATAKTSAIVAPLDIIYDLDSLSTCEISNNMNIELTMARIQIIVMYGASAAPVSNNT